MRKIEFHNREKELKEIRNLLDAEPSLITFIYGPINSGKTALINHLIEQLPEDYVVFYINLRTKILASYDDFIESLFEMELTTDLTSRKRRETLKELISSVTRVTGIPITREFMDYVFQDNKPKNAFSYMIKLFEVVRASGKQPVLVLDEFQKIGDVNVDGTLIYELFNFFIDLTKEQHLCHVFAVSSDSLFIERVYSEAMLEGRCRYLLVDDFDEAATKAFMVRHGFTEAEKALTWEYCGGKPVCLIELVNSESRENKAKEMRRIRKGQIDQRIRVLKIVSKKILFEEETIDLKYDHITKILDVFLDEESYAYEVITPEIAYLVKANILFVDPVSGIIKPQSRLNLLAIREVMKGDN